MKIRLNRLVAVVRRGIIKGIKIKEQKEETNEIYN